ncbi:pyridoxal phosphate-dependent transferase [Hysterangium stoloniferum]|nr:pyridoxal phosphate-dependent transferase [Hysterangium stoloniferum]
MADHVQQLRDTLFREVKVDVNLAVDNEATKHTVSRSFISDTITVPTKEMYDYATRSSLGDDVYEEPSTNQLERHIAQLFGKEAAIFLSSGSMSNQIALRAHLTRPPHSVLCDIRSHINCYEGGGAAYHSQAAVTAVVPSNGTYSTFSYVEKHIITGTDVHFANTRVIALENTLNGCVIPQDEILKISAFAKTEGVRMHLDGARIWHVAAETGTSLSELCAPFDSVSCCFSKGLGAPVGSCLIGSAELVTHARWLRKLFGGGMRQTGILAGSAAYALSNHFQLLPGVHALARKLEQGLRAIGVQITSPAETCMVFYNPAPIGLTYEEIMERAASLPDPIKVGGSRLVIHIQTSSQAVDDFINLLKRMSEEKGSATDQAAPPVDANDVAADLRDIYVRVKNASKA